MHSFDSLGPVSHPLPPTPPLTADPRRRERTAPHCERSRVGSWVRGGYRGVAGAAVRHGGVVRGAGRFNETRPHHPLRAGRARLLVRRNASPIQLPRSQGTSARASPTDATAFPLRHAATPLPCTVHRMSHPPTIGNQDRPGFRENGRFVRFPVPENLPILETQMLQLEIKDEDDPERFLDIKYIVIRNCLISPFHCTSVRIIDDVAMIINFNSGK